MEIICSSPATAYDSLANLFHCSTTALQQFIRKNWAANNEKAIYGMKRIWGSIL